MVKCLLEEYKQEVLYAQTPYNDVIIIIFINNFLNDLGHDTNQRMG